MGQKSWRERESCASAINVPDYFDTLSPERTCVCLAAPSCGSCSAGSASSLFS